MFNYQSEPKNSVEKVFFQCNIFIELIILKILYVKFSWIFINTRDLKNGSQLSFLEQNHIILISQNCTLENCKYCNMQMHKQKLTQPNELPHPYNQQPMDYCNYCHEFESQPTQPDSVLNNVLTVQYCICDKILIKI